MPRIDCGKNSGALCDFDDSKNCNRQEPQNHYGTKYPTHFCRSLFLNQKQSQQNRQSRRNDEDVELRSDNGETFGCPEYGHRWRYDAVSIQQSGTRETKRDDDESFCGVGLPLLCLKNQCKQSELAAFAPIVSTHDEDDVFDADDDDERPEDERKHTEDVFGIGNEPVLFLEALANRVKRACSDVTVNNADCEQCKLRETAARGMSFWLRAYWMLLRAAKRTNMSNFSKLVPLHPQ